MKRNVVLVGAGGKMGCRITKNIKDRSEYLVSYVEISEEGIERLKELGVNEISGNEVYSSADIIILAVPDVLIGKISENVIPLLKSGAMIIGLDPAAAYADVMPIRENITYFVAHPCHPALFSDFPTLEEKNDWFGGIAQQDVVCAMYKGKDEKYVIGEEIARIIYAPIKNTFRVTVEQMAILEPALVETFTLTLISKIKEAFDHVIKMGVPEEAAKSFLLGHLRVEFGIVFGWAGFNFSDGAKLAMEKAEKVIFKDNWKDILKLENIHKSVEEITGAINK